MDSPVSPKDEIWFLRVRHHVSNAVYMHSRITYSYSRKQAGISFNGDE
jgi:hypothetical protein